MRLPTRPFLRAVPFVLSFVAAAAAPMAYAPAARAQVSDADRAAARELYIQGVKLQEQGKFAEALDRFSRAQQVFSAPTHLLHIAECQAALGKLVEASETYRTLVRTPLPPGSPTAFTQAQQQGSAELTHLEPRVPSLKVQVRPETAQNLSVQIDGQPMSAALVGVPRPIDPGNHTVSVFAPGYGKAEEKVTIREKEQRDLTLTLQSSGVVYTNPLPPATGAGAGAGAAARPAPTTTTTPPPYGQPANAPPPYVEAAPPSARRRSASTAFVVGPRLGVLVPGGSFGSADASVPASDVGDTVGTGFDLGVEGGLRFARVLYVGAVFEHGFHAKGDKTSSLASNVPQGFDLTSTAASNYFGAEFAWISNPDGVGFYAEVGVGYRWLARSAKVDQAGSEIGTLTTTFKGTEGNLGLGVHVKVGDRVRLIPKIGVSAGSFQSYDQSCSSSTDFCSGITNVSDQSLSNSKTHTFVFFGLAGLYDFGKSPAP